MLDRQNKTWSEEELYFLQDKWGDWSAERIGKSLGRTASAVILKAKSLRLGSFWKNTEYLNAYNITQLMGIDSHVIERTWKRHGFKMRRKKIRVKQYFEVIKHKDLMGWLEEHQDLWDSRKVAEYALGTEPEWLKEKRKRDNLITTKSRGTKYTPEEDSKLVMMFKAGKTQAEIGRALNRSEASVNARIGRLDIWGTGRLKKHGDKLRAV